MILQFTRRLALLATAMTVVAACSGDKTTNPGTPDIAFGTQPLAVTVARNATGTVQLTLSRSGNYTGTINLVAEGVPAGVTATFNPASLTSGTTSVMSVVVGNTAAPGTHTITVRATGQGLTDKTTTVTLTIPTPAMSLALGATTTTLTQGASGTVPVTITRTNGFDQTVTLTAEGLPTGVTASFNPAQLTANGTTSTLTLTAANNAVVGNATVTVRAAGTGVPDQTATFALTVNAATTPDFSLSAAPAAHNVAAGTNAQSDITISRTGGFAGAVTLALEDAPAGVTGTFNPASPTTATSTLTLNTTAATVPGTYNLTVRGTGAGITGTRATQISLTITAPPGLTLALSVGALSVVQGQTGQTVVTVTRTGGLAGNVTMALEGAPAGVTGTFTPNPATGATSTLTLNVAANTATGVHNLAVRGTGTGNVTTTVPLQLTVTPPVGQGANVSWQFCDADRIPLWFAFRDGANGAWTRVNAGANNTFAFTLTQAVGGVAYVTQEFGGTELEVLYLTAAEMNGVAQAECITNFPSGKVLQGTVTGLGEDELANIAMGGASTSFEQSQYTLFDVAPGPQDLLGVRGVATLDANDFPESFTPNRMVLLRNINLPNNGTLPPVDFTHASSFAPVSATITLTNTGANPVMHFQSWVTATQLSNMYAGDFFAPGGNTITFYGIPTARMLTGELHELFAITGNEEGTEGRTILTYFREVVNKTFAFGPVLSTPNITSSASGGVALPRAQGTFQAAYDASIGVAFVQEDLNKAVSISASRNYFGANPVQYDLQTPNLVGVTGFNTAWGLTPGVTTQANMSGIGMDGTPPAAIGAATLKALQERRAEAKSVQSRVAAKQSNVSAKQANVASSTNSIPLSQLFAGLVLLIAFLQLNFTA